MGRRAPASVGVLVALGMCIACATLPASIAATPPAAELPRAITVEALSSGKGVPPSTRSALDDMRSLLRELQGRGQLVRLDEKRIGIEGETRMCVEFKDARTARDTLERLRAIARGVDLLNIAERPCGQP